MQQSREQKLVDICFELAITAAQSPYFRDKNKEQIAEWVADQLRKCGFNTEPCGMSWGVLVSHAQLRIRSG